MFCNSPKIINAQNELRPRKKAKNTTNLFSLSWIEEKRSEEIGPLLKVDGTESRKKGRDTHPQPLHSCCLAQENITNATKLEFDAKMIWGHLAALEPDNNKNN